MDLKIVFVLDNKKTKQQTEDVKKLNSECFSNIPQQEIEEDFYAKIWGRIIAYKNKLPIGTLGIYKRSNTFAGQKLLVGGLGGVCITKNERKKGIATKMCEQGLEILKKEGCDVACLNVDLEKKAYRVYENLGFKFMERKVSFTNSKGIKKFEKGTMFIPLNSKEKYNLLMSSEETFHYGNGHW